MTEEISEKMTKLGYKNPASILSQSNILSGMEAAGGMIFDSIGVISLSGYPTQKGICVKRYSFSHKSSGKDVLAGFINIKYINHLIGKLNLIRLAKAWAKKKCDDEVEIVVYEMRSSCLAAAQMVKKFIRNSHITLIIPDLPMFMDLSMGGLKRFLKSVDQKQMLKMFSCVDHFIVYTQNMVDYLGIQSKHWMVMEGSINVNEIDTPLENVYNSEKFIVMYSGAVQLGFQIQNLLDAFRYLDDSYELWITGGGSASDLVKEYAVQNDNIRYYGYLPTRQKLRDLQAKATIMINMRNPSEKASMYCFPSKLFDYMLLGKPVLSCRLKGIPDEYFKYLIPLESTQPEKIADSIRAIASMSREELDDIGKKSRKFVIEEKNNTIQGRKIFDFIESN